MLPSFRLRLTTLWPALAALVSAALLLWVLLPGLLEQNTARQLQAALRILSPIVAERVEELGDRPVHDWIASLADGGSARLTLISPNGRVLADSSQSYREMLAMDNHGRRAEIVMAAATGQGHAVRRSATTGRQYVYAARTFRARDGGPYTLRLAQPLEQLALLRRRLAEVMVVATAIGLLAMGLVSWHLDRRFFRPLMTIIESAGQLPAKSAKDRLAIPVQSDLARLAALLNRLSDRVDEQLADLQKERDQLRAILSSMNEGVLLTDAGGQALLANLAFQEMFHLSGDVKGLFPLEICRQPQLAQVVEEVLGEPDVPAPERRLETSGGRAIAVTATSLAGSGGAVVVARDITDEDRIVAMRRDFVANVSHELKTPLTAIRGYAETMRDGALDDRPAAERFIDRILGQCHRLQALLQDLLTLSRLETLHFTPDENPINLTSLASRALELVAPQAASKQVELELQAAPVPGVRGVQDDLERLLLNLLENAVKYNRPDGRVTVRTTSDNGHVVVEVSDTGIGIAKDAQPRLFERFYRVDKGRSRAAGGTGLGLSIVKHVAQAHGGDVEVQSIQGKGSTFRVRLPAA